MKKLIAIIITLIFIFEGASYGLRVPIADNQERKLAAIARIKVRVYTDANRIKRIDMASIPECATKELLKIIRGNPKLRGKVFLMGGAVRDLLLGIEPHDFDCLILDNNGKLVSNPGVLKDYLDPDVNSYFKGVKIESVLYAVDIDYAKGKRKFNFIISDLSVNHMIIGFDDKSEDPFLDDPDDGYKDLLHQEARVKGGIKFTYWSSLFDRIIKGMVLCDLTPIGETNELIEKSTLAFLAENHEQVWMYKFWKIACYQNRLRERIRQVLIKRMQIEGMLRKLFFTGLSEEIKNNL